VATVVPKLTERPDPCPEGCNTALDHALITEPEARDPEVLRKLEALLGRVLSS
jgi:5'-methylthioadenosine phosphorylase